MRHNSSKSMAIGGLTAALAAVIMCLGGLIPVATYVCPMMCCLLLQYVAFQCGKRIGWAWYTAVAILSILICPDKEAAAVYTALGFYPLIKPGLEKMKLQWLLKFAVFNLCSSAAYVLLILIMGVEELGMGTLGIALLILLIVLGNITFFLLDRLLSLLAVKMKHKNRNPS